MNCFLYYILLINLLSFIVALTDKSNAVKHTWRISENCLMLLSVIGGSIGLLLCLLLSNHKTRKVKFMVGVPIIILVQIVILALFFNEVIL